MKSFLKGLYAFACGFFLQRYEIELPNTDISDDWNAVGDCIIWAIGEYRENLQRDN